MFPNTKVVTIGISMFFQTLPKILFFGIVGVSNTGFPWNFNVFLFQTIKKTLFRCSKSQTFLCTNHKVSDNFSITVCITRLVTFRNWPFMTRQKCMRSSASILCDSMHHQMPLLLMQQRCNTVSNVCLKAWFSVLLLYYFCSTTRARKKPYSVATFVHTFVIYQRAINDTIMTLSVYIHHSENITMSILPIKQINQYSQWLLFFLEVRAKALFSVVSRCVIHITVVVVLLTFHNTNTILQVRTLFASAITLLRWSAMYWSRCTRTSWAFHSCLSFCTTERGSHCVVYIYKRTVFTVW